MKVIDRYLILSYLRMLGLSVAAFTGIFLLVTAFEKMGTLMKNNAAMLDIILYLSAKIPWILTQVVPIASLVGAVVTLSIMSRDNEVIALRTSGISLWRIATPFVAVGLCLTGLTFFLQESLSPAAWNFGDYVYNVRIKKIDYSRILPKSNVWLRYGPAWVHVGNVVPDSGVLMDVEAFETRDGEVTRQIWASQASWSGSSWILKDAKVIDYTKNMGLKEVVVADLEYPIAPPKEDIFIEDREPERMSMADLSRLINTSKSQGLNTKSLEVDWWAKTSMPFTCALMPVIAVPFALRTSRKGGLWAGVAMGLGLGFAYMLTMMLGLALGHADAVPPQIAAWLGNAIFLVVAIVLLKKAETH